MRNLIVTTAFLAMFCCAGAEDWPQWRGAKGDGVSMDKTWDAARVNEGKVLWKIDAGEGYSAVAVVKERVFTVGNAGGKDSVLCLDAATGKELWRFSYPCGTDGSYPGPRCSPAVDVGQAAVYVLSREGGLYCIDAAKGTEKWSKNLKQEYGAQPPAWAFSSSPRIEDGLLLVNAGAKGFAFDKKSGEKVWADGAGKGSYSSPVVYSRAGKKYVAIFAAKHAYGVELLTGKEVWSYPWETAHDVNAADPVVSGDLVYLSSGYGKGGVLLDISGEVKPVWENKEMKSHFGSLVFRSGFIYGVDGQAGNKAAELRCIEMKTGSQKWSEKLGFGAISGAGDKLLFISEGGRLVVADADPSGYREVASTQLQMKGQCWTMPVLANGRIYCRSVRGDLVCVDARK